MTALRLVLQREPAKKIAVTNDDETANIHNLLDNEN